MALFDQIQSEMKEAMRAKDRTRLDTLRMLKSAVVYAAGESGSSAQPPSDEAVIQAIRKEMKKRDDAAQSFRDAGRAEQADREEAEKAVLARFLPAPLSADELQQLIAEAIRETGATSRKEMGAVMKLLTARTAGRADGKTLSQAVQAALA